MSFLSDIFKGNFGNLGHDLFGSPTAIAETLGGAGALALPFLAPELLGAAFLPTAGEAAAGAAAGEAAPASLGALFGGAGAGGLGAADAAGGLGALAEAAPDAPIVDPTFGIPGLGGTGQGVNAAGLVGAGPQFVPNPIQPDFAAIGTGSDVLGGQGGGAFANIPGDVPALSYDAPAAVPTTGATPAAGGGGIDTLPSIGSGGPVPNAPTIITAPGATPPAQGFGASFAQNFNPSAIGSALGKGLANPLTDIGLAGLGLNLYSGYQQKQELAKVAQQEATAAGTAAQAAQQTQAAAQPLIANGETLMKYLTTGTLPPEFQAQVKQQVDAIKAQIIQGYANRGMSTNPAQNSALAQELANADLQSESLKANLESTLATAGNQMTQTANSLIASGLSATQLSAEIPIQMQKLDTELAAETSKAVASFAAAMNSGQGTGKFTLTPATA